MQKTYNSRPISFLYHEKIREKDQSPQIDSEEAAHYNETFVGSLHTKVSICHVTDVQKAIEFKKKTGSRISKENEYEKWKKGDCQTSEKRSATPDCFG